MRKKLMLLTLALAAVAGAGLFSAPPSDAAACNGILVCCPETGTCRCCSRPCPIQCP